MAATQAGINSAASSMTLSSSSGGIPSKDSPFSSPHSARIGTRGWPSRLDLNSRSQASARSMAANLRGDGNPAALAFGDAAEYEAPAIPTRRDRRFIMFHQHKTVGGFYLVCADQIRSTL